MIDPEVTRVCKSEWYRQTLHDVKRISCRKVLQALAFDLVRPHLAQCKVFWFRTSAAELSDQHMELLACSSLGNRVVDNQQKDSETRTRYSVFDGSNLAVRDQRRAWPVSAVEQHAEIVVRASRSFTLKATGSIAWSRQFPLAGRSCSVSSIGKRDQ